MKKEWVYRLLFYIVGLLLLALGIILNTKVTLGVSPIISVAYATSEIAETNFGDTTFALYATFVIIEMIFHTIRRNKYEESLKSLLTKDFLQLPLSLIFTRFLNLFSFMIPEFETAYPEHYLGDVPARIIILLFAIIFTGIGAILSLNMRLIPNPGDGIVQVLAEFAEKDTGFIKNCFDTLMISITILSSYLCTGHLIGIGVGTVLAVIGVGRVIAVFNHFTKQPIAKLTGLTS